MKIIPKSSSLSDAKNHQSVARGSSGPDIPDSWNMKCNWI